MKKFGAFTMVELVVTLLISSVLVTILYYSYLSLGRQFRQYAMKADTIGDFTIFQSMMQKDADAADVISDSSGCLLFKNFTGKEITYLQDSSFITRISEGVTDFFALKSSRWLTKPVSDSLPIVKSIWVKLKIGNEIIETNFMKNYSASQLMYTEINNDEQ